MDSSRGLASHSGISKIPGHFCVNANGQVHQHRWLTSSISPLLLQPSTLVKQQPVHQKTLRYDEQTRYMTHQTVTTRDPITFSHTTSFPGPVKKYKQCTNTRIALISLSRRCQCLQYPSSSGRVRQVLHPQTSVGLRERVDQLLEVEHEPRRGRLHLGSHHVTAVP